MLRVKDKLGRRLKIEYLFVDAKHQLLELEEAILNLWRDEDASEDAETSEILPSRARQEACREEDEDWPPGE